MTVVSFDVGVRNLAVCMLDYTPLPETEDNVGTENPVCLIESDDEEPTQELGGDKKKERGETDEKKERGEKEKEGKSKGVHIYYPMKYWGVLDLMEEENADEKKTENACCNVMKSGKRKGEMCGKPGRYLVEELKYCAVHNPNKKDLEKSKKTEIKQKKRKKVASVTTQNLCIALVKQLDSVNDMLLQADEVLIELQPSVNPKMKMISNMIYCHYIRFGVMNPESPIKSVKFVSARKKLTVYNGPKVECNLKGEYAKRKKLGIAYCKYMVKDDSVNSKLFENHKKKDDLADCFLQGVWYLKGIYAKEEARRKKEKAARKKAGIKWMSRKKYAKTKAAEEKAKKIPTKAKKTTTKAKKTPTKAKKTTKANKTKQTN